MRDIKNYEGLYAVTSCGKVWSYRNKKFLSPRINNKGYLRVALSKSGVIKDFYIHRLVADAYIPNADNKPNVNHLDENPLNNNINNLEWVTQKENMNFGTCQERKAQHQLKAVFCIELNKAFSSAKQAAEELNLYAGNITRCCKGNSQTTGGYHFRYYNS